MAARFVLQSLAVPYFPPAHRSLVTVSYTHLDVYKRQSEGDEMSRADFQDEYRAIAGETGAEICIFAEGRHPAILSNAEEAAERISKFLE